MKKMQLAFGAMCAVALTGSAMARPLGATDINGVKVDTYIFADRPDSVLNVTNNFPSAVGFDEGPFGQGGFANRHAAYFSTDGGSTKRDFNYEDSFNIKAVMTKSSTDVDAEAGIHADLFGFGFFGVLPNGEVAAFGSILPFYSAGIVAPMNFQGSMLLQMIYRAGNGDGTTAGAGTIPSTIEYIFDLGAGPVSSGLIPFTNGEGGIPSAFTFNVGVGVQNNQADPVLGMSSVQFTDIMAIPTPGALTLLGLGGLVGLRRRR